MKKQILEEIEKHLNNFDEEIVHYGYSLVLTTNKENEQYLYNVTTINKNYNNGVFPSCPTIRI